MSLNVRTLCLMFQVFFLAVLVPRGQLFQAAAASANACDLNGDGVVNSTDAQLAINMDLGLTPCTANVIGPSICNILVVQHVIDAATGHGCVTVGGAHSVALSWAASTSTGLAGYNIYRGSTSGGPYTKVSASVVAGTSYTDATVQAGQTYYYVSTAVSTGGTESIYSNQAQATVPSP
jgi:hypothetical protein